MVLTTSESREHGSADESEVIRGVEADLREFRNNDLGFEPGEDHVELWTTLYSRGNRLLIGPDDRVNLPAIRDFWRNHTYIADNPRMGEPKGISRLDCQRRGEMEMLRRVRKVLRRYGYGKLIRKYACPRVGNPHLFHSGGAAFTHRWIRHIFHLGRMNEFLAPHLDPGFTLLDIGSGHGLFPYLVHREYPGSHSVLVDLPESLLLARYFLGMTLPGARIAGISELAGLETITREWLTQYDFVLLPWQFYEKLESGSVDLIASFAALGEFKRHVFNYYVDAPVFRTAKFLHTANPVQSDAMFEGSDLTLLDYPLDRGEGCFHFGISPAFKFPYVLPKRLNLFIYEMRQLTPFFEYIGRLHFPGQTPSG